MDETIADVSNRAYNPSGQVAASAYRFPFPDATFDFVFAASVFTHMLPDEVEWYLREIARVLAPGGACVASYFLLNDNSRSDVIAGQSFMSFAVEHPSGLCRLHDATMPEAAVALEESFVRRAHEQAGLQIQAVHRGGWRKGEVHHQDILTATRAMPAIPARQSA